MGTKTNPGRYNNYERIGPDVPFIILSADDPLAVDLTELYEIRARSLVYPSDHVLELKQAHEEMAAWQAEQYHKQNAEKQNDDNS